jgi:peptide/nickel transport system substrate-binding protein
MSTTDPNSIWSDIRMRQALEYAIDKEGVAKSIGLGFMPAPYSIIHSVTAMVDAGTTPRKYDPEKAKALIAEAGKSGAEVTLHFNATETDPNLATAIQANLAAVGINLKIDALPSASFAPISVKPPAGNDIIMNGLRGGSPNVLQGALEMYGKGSIYFPAAAWSDEFYKLADQAQQTENLTDSFPIVAQMEKLAYDELQVVPVMITDFVSVSGPTMKNMKWNFANLPGPWFQEIWVVK